jgi:hypothetical protein
MSLNPQNVTEKPKTSLLRSDDSGVSVPRFTPRSSEPLDCVWLAVPGRPFQAWQEPLLLIERSHWSSAIRMIILICI